MDNGIKMLGDSIVVPAPMTFLCRGNNIYVPSANSENYVICSFIRAEFSCGESVIIHRMEKMRDVVFEEICKVGTVEGRLGQLLSDFCSGRKGATKDRFFEALGYGSLLYRLNL